jgi:hypothetical protein
MISRHCFLNIIVSHLFFTFVLRGRLHNFGPVITQNKKTMLKKTNPKKEKKAQKPSSFGGVSINTFNKTFKIMSYTSVKCRKRSSKKLMNYIRILSTLFGISKAVYTKV